MTRPCRRPVALLTLVASIVGLAACVGLARGDDLGLSRDVPAVVAGIEGEEIPLPTRSSFVG